MPEPIDPIEALLDELLTKLHPFDRLDRKWFAEALLDDIGCIYGVGDEEDPIAAIRDVGEGYVAAVALAIRRQPERTGDAFRVAHTVLVALLDEVMESPRGGGLGPGD